MWWIIYLCVAFVACTIAAVTDTKSGEIPNWLTYPLIIVGFLVSLFPYTFPNFVFGVIFMILAYGVYKYKLFGGGDIKLILGLILLNPSADIMFIIWWLSISCVIAMLFYLVKYIKGERGKKLEALKFGVPMFIGMFIMLAINLLPLIIG